MGAAVDRALAAGNVRLTMGGEPTFVAAADFDEPEWNTDALGPTKQRLAEKLMHRLRERWAPGSALQNVSGKHYPGEQLPRWALYAHWRKDGEPVWRDPALLAGAEDADTATAADAHRFCAALAERLQVDPSLVNPAYEDVHYYLWREHRLPENVLAEDAKLGDPMERARLARVFGHGLGSPVGSVLPLRRAIRDGVRVWQSGKWFFRGGALFLLPGDSPIGYRLPLDSLPWEDPDRIEHETEPDPFAPRTPLPPRQAFDHAASLMGAGAEGFRPIVQELPVMGRDEPDLVRTALCVEPRDGDDPRVLPAALRRRGLADAGRRGRGHRRGTGTQGGAGRLPAAARSRSAALLGHPRSRRDRGQRASRVELERDRAARRGTLRGRAPGRTGDGKVHARRPPCRHRRRQPCGDGRGGTRGQSVPAPTRSAEVAARLLAQPSEPLVPVQRAVHRAVEPASAHRRGAAGQPGRTGDRVLAGQTRRGGGALAGRSDVPSSAR